MGCSEDSLESIIRSEGTNPITSHKYPYLRILETGRHLNLKLSISRNADALNAFNEAQGTNSVGIGDGKHGICSSRSDQLNPYP